MHISPRRVDQLLIASFAIVLLYSLWTITIGWGTSLNLQYDFVQAKAAIGAYYIAKGGPIFRYELPVLGPPWSVPYEFPIFQILSAWLFKLSGLSLDSAGRLVAKSFFYLSCIPIASIARTLGFRGKQVLIPVVLFLASPIYLFWSRQFMNESTATFFGIAYLAAVMVWGRSRDWKWLLGAVALGVLASVAKSTTYAGFGLAAALFLAVEIIRSRDYRFLRLLQASVVFVLPLLAGVLWVRFTDGVKELNPLAVNAHTSAALAKWYLFSSWSERTNGNLWYHFFRITLHDAIGHRAGWIFSVLFACLLGRKAWLYWLSSLFFLVAPMLFPYVHLLHDYYANANAVFLVFAIGALVQAALLSPQRWARVVGLAFFLVVLGYEVRDFMGKGFYQLQETRTASVSFGRKLQSVLPPEEVMLMYGEDWCPLIPYYAERRAIMMANSGWYNPALAESLSLLKAEGRQVGAIVLCHEARTDRELLGKISLGRLLLRDTCDVYARP
jgi:hypothetical protein